MPAQYAKGSELMQDFAILCHDKPESGAIRKATRDAHLAYIDRFADQVIVAGPLLSEDGERMLGSLIVMRFADRAAAEAFCADDPYGQAGLFERVEITRWRQVRPKD